jgi:Zn-dependent M28 family amino/carboxypeptidase
VELGLLLINVLGNSSPGAIDNATGCTAILKILDHLKELKSDLEWCDLRILFSGAYEWGIWGAHTYLSIHQEELAHYKDIFVINLDSLAAPLQILHKKRLYGVNPPNTILNDLILHEARRIHRTIISNQKQLLLGNDSFPFLKIGCELVSIQSNASLLHTQVDRLDRVDIKVVEDIVEIFVNVLPLLDQWIGDKIRSAE